MNLPKADLFLEMEQFSNSFIKLHNCKHDPFHQWSRCWEYPFTYSHILWYVNSKLNEGLNNKVEILDAGSGFTFFPYYISHRNSNCNVHCCDYDRSLSDYFIEANKKSEEQVDFKIYDLTNLGYGDDVFNIICCISVLEHISNHEEILEQFKRVLKPDGLLILTFDISLEDIGKSEGYAQKILDHLNSRFTATDTRLQRIKIPSETEILTTKFAKDIDKKMLPWVSTWSSALGDLKKLRIPRSPFSFLTIFCGIWRNMK